MSDDQCVLPILSDHSRILRPAGYLIDVTANSKVSKRTIEIQNSESIARHRREHLKTIKSDLN